MSWCQASPVPLCAICSLVHLPRRARIGQTISIRPQSPVCRLAVISLQFVGLHNRLCTVQCHRRRSRRRQISRRSLVTVALDFVTQLLLPPSGLTQPIRVWLRLAVIYVACAVRVSGIGQPSDSLSLPPSPATSKLLSFSHKQKPCGIGTLRFITLVVEATRGILGPFVSVNNSSRSRDLNREAVSY